jgi:hypothetical protein
MRKWSVSAFFPEVKPEHAATQSCSAEASTIPRAIAIAMIEILQRDAIKGRHIAAIQISVVAIGKHKASEAAG